MRTLRKVITETELVQVVVDDKFNSDEKVELRVYGALGKENDYIWIKLDRNEVYQLAEHFAFLSNFSLVRR